MLHDLRMSFNLKHRLWASQPASLTALIPAPPPVASSPRLPRPIGNDLGSVCKLPASSRSFCRYRLRHSHHDLSTGPPRSPRRLTDLQGPPMDKTLQTFQDPSLSPPFSSTHASQGSLAAISAILCGRCNLAPRLLRMPPSPHWDLQRCHLQGLIERIRAESG